MKDPKARIEKAKVFPFIPTGEYYFNKGVKAYDRFDISKAKKYLKRALELEPDEAMIACQLAIVHTEAGEYSESNKLLFMVLEDLDSEMTECHYFISNNFAHLGMFTDAFKHAQLYLELDPIGEFTIEAEELMQLIGLEDEDNLDSLVEQDEIINNLETSRVLLEKGDFIEAVQLLEKTIHDFPEFWPAYNNLALAYFYEGETGKAAGILEKVLENNPGNLHALCNLAVFLYYEKETEQLNELLDALDKVQPMLFEHRYKLGATFALTGKYDQAYFWLRQIQKYGYEGDAGYYYWLAKAAYFTGNKKVANTAWDILSKMNPEQNQIEPWNVKEHPDPRNMGDDHAVLKMIQSERIEVRLYGLFLISTLENMQDIFSHSEFKRLEDFSLTEKLYMTHILRENLNAPIHVNEYIASCHEVAVILYERYKEAGLYEREILLSWFSIFIQIFGEESSLKNPKAFAAATEYIWLKQSHNKKTQKEITEEYGISQATLRKYIKFIEIHWE
ncbi:tetratricopeptide repeat protein [Lederbergia wuyishanensis]|uniref:Tetratricopeptide (TPR) repeat protein n=1 Tax=Lederbergia wuyishanensis TaxID=1347903 RepID=A0ABU0D8M7_9BACI|nr:tetratricopeptide repeat protein [Lederbergia wuyishanensis]MCJ8007688.1 tetratricopeptide repeat protein [Lederbergia wuyishanensis]MDQ0344728.1 tetratricopeptide (TPR) repeat protein [Lederbergia wuyishanensis]